MKNLRYKEFLRVLCNIFPKLYFSHHQDFSFSINYTLAILHKVLTSDEFFSGLTYKFYDLHIILSINREVKFGLSNFRNIIKYTLSIY